MLNTIDQFLDIYNEYVGTYLIMFTLIPIGIFYTIKFRFYQFTRFIHTLKITAGKYKDPKDKGDISPFKALATAMSSTIGTGNIVGVSLAIYWGGPGAIFWMWITGIFGMILKFAEGVLALKYRKVNEDGTISGGPMYYIEYALKERLGVFAKILAVIFAIATVLCSFGIGDLAQSNSISSALNSSYGIPTWMSACSLALMVFVVVIGGIKRISSISGKLVPFMAGIYVLTAMLILILYYKEIPAGLLLIISDAFDGTAATGGFVGATFIYAARFGVARGLFSNEAGQGSSPIAHAAAKGTFPVRQGLVASICPFIDTIIICTMTALVVIMTGTWNSGIMGVEMTTTAFAKGLEPIGLSFMGEHIITITLLLFASSTILSWSYYGDKAIEYLVGKKGILPYRMVYIVFAFLGAVWSTDFVWSFTDMVITFMTIPNLVALLLLYKVILKEKDKYEEYMLTVDQVDLYKSDIIVSSDLTFNISK